MSPLLIGVAIAVAVVASLFFSTLTYSLRDFSRVRLAEYLEARNRSRWLEPTAEHINDLIFVTAVCRLLANIGVLVAMLRMFHNPQHIMTRGAFFAATAITLLLTFFSSVAFPHAVAKYAGETVIGIFAPLLHALRLVLSPLIRLMNWIDDLVRRAAGASEQPQPEEIEQDILSVVEEGEKEGVVDETEREMIESVIEFGDTTVGQIMTARPEIIALDARISLQEAKRKFLDSGHSRIPVYEGSLDHVIGILYARDMLRHLGQPPEKFDARAMVRPPLYVPETKPLDDLLEDFRSQKIHVAIVLDEYGGTAGLVTIEDILEELVGEISDEHELTEPAMLQRIDDQTLEADARMYIDELNRQVGLGLPEDAGYETLGGFVSTTAGRIPQKDERFEYNGHKFTVLDAEPQKVNRVRIELSSAPAVPAEAVTAAPDDTAVSAPAPDAQ